jgi:hypothetical protein
MAASAETGTFQTRAEMAARYRVGLRTFDRWVHDGRLPKIKITARCVRFDPIRCDEAVRRFTIQEVTGMVGQEHKGQPVCFPIPGIERQAVNKIRR